MLVGTAMGVTDIGLTTGFREEVGHGSTFLVETLYVPWKVAYTVT